MGEALAVNTTLTQLNLEEQATGEKIGKGGGQAIAEALLLNKTRGSQHDAHHSRSGIKLHPGQGGKKDRKGALLGADPG